MIQTTEHWLENLKAGFDAGYYRTEAAVGERASFPWHGKRCKNCPFWANSICQVFAEYRSSTAHTCSYFDPWNRPQAQSIIQERQRRGVKRWWEWFNDRGATR